MTYGLPFGRLGRLAHAALVHRQLRALWAYRQRRLGQLVTGAGVTTT